MQQKCFEYYDSAKILAIFLKTNFLVPKMKGFESKSPTLYANKILINHKNSPPEEVHKASFTVFRYPLCWCEVVCLFIHFFWKSGLAKKVTDGFGSKPWKQCRQYSHTKVEINRTRGLHSQFNSKLTWRLISSSREPLSSRRGWNFRRNFLRKKEKSLKLGKQFLFHRRNLSWGNGSKLTTIRRRHVNRSICFFGP
jgi:hypothetical protein